MLRLRIACLSAFAAPVALASTSALAGGFYLQEQSPTAVGRAFAGEAAIADGPATIWYNPAGMTNLPGAQIDLGAHLLDVTSRQSDRGSTRSYPGAGNFPVGGGNGGNPFSNPVLVPSGYASFHVNDSRLWLGLGISAPFGLKVVYDDGWFGRYDSVGSDLKTLNIQPSIAFKINDRLSIGGGFDVQTLHADLTSALPNLAPGLPDGGLRIHGQDMAFGWNVGVRADLGALKLGASYRSHVDHKLSGVAQISGLLGPLAGQNASIRAFAPISTPDIATVSGVFGQGNARLLGSVTWTNWSRFQRIAVQNDAGQVFLDSEQNYRDTWTYSVGGEFDLSKRMTLRAGAMYDQTPTVDGFRTTRVPDGNRIWATTGATLRVNDMISLNASYAHIFVKTADVNRIDPIFAGTPAQVQVATRSTNTGNADELAGSVTFKF